MSVCAVMLVKDEADIVEPILRHLAANLDEIIVLDNRSTDGTLEILDVLRREIGIVVRADDEVGYYQAEKTTALANEARERGHQWVVPCDADEFWYATDGRTIREYLHGLAPDVAQVEAHLYHHLPSILDAEDEPNPLLRIQVRQREHGSMGKVACRLCVGLEIRQGNHSAYQPGGGLKIEGGLAIRHFSWRSEEQYLRKITNGAAAYAATSLPPSTGEHWRQFGNPPNLDAAREWYLRWAYKVNPLADDSLILDPAPVG